jgi:hypothetical protein
MRFLFALLLWAGALVAPAYAGTMYTVNNSTGALMKIDTGTLALTTVGPLGVAFAYGSLAWDSANSTLYMVDGRGAKSLYTVNTTTGAATLVGAHGLTDMFGIAFDTANGIMYGAQEILSSPLQSINLSTGVATAIGTGVGNARLGPLAYNNVTNQLIGLQDCLSCAVLYSINIATGVQTVLRNTGLDTNNSGMTYDPALNRLWDVDVNGRLTYFDPAAGYVQVPVTTFATSLTGLAYVTGAVAPPAITPVPTLSDFGLALLAIMLLGAAVVSLRRRRMFSGH